MKRSNFREYNEAVSVIFVDTQIIDARAFAEIMSLVQL